MKWDAAIYDAVKAPQIDAGRELLSLAGVREEDAVLDLGCGTGKLTVELARLVPRGSVVGLDPSPEMLEKAHEATSGMMNVRFARVSAETMNFADEFDLVFSNSALHWIRDQERAVSRVFRSLRRGGRIAFQMPAKDFCTEFFDSVGEAITSLGYERFYEGWRSPWRFPEKEEYASLLAETGFRDIKVYAREYRLCFGPLSDVVNWWSSAGLRPYLACLPEGAQEHFKAAFGEGFERKRTAKGIEFDFRRLFAFGEHTHD